MVRFALPFGAFTRLGQDIHKTDILMVFGKIEEGHNPKVVGSSPTRGAITDRVIDTIYQLLYRFFMPKNPHFKRMF